jgi:hypothetical protein
LDCRSQRLVKQQHPITMVLARSMSGTITISIEVPVDLQLKFGVRMNLVRHGNFFSEGSS